MKKFALVTGSTKGIGKQIAIDLLREGHFVILNYAHSDADAEKVKLELNGISTNFKIVKADLSSMEGLERLVAEIQKITGVLDYLVLNAGATKRSGFEEITIEDWNTIFNVNLTMPFFMVQRTYPCIRNDGRIIFIGSVLGRMPHATSIPYGVTKAALETLVKYLVANVSSKRITVNVVAPGFTDTDWQKGKDSKQRARIENKIALKRFANPKEIASTCMHLIANGYINGQTIYVDGGYALS